MRLILLLVASSLSGAAQAGPTGTWDVVGVAIDETTGRAQAFAIDDPRLVGRSVTFAADSIQTSMDEGGCEKPNFVVKSETIDAAFAKAFGKTQDGKPHDVADFGLERASMKNAKMVMIKCGLGGGYYDDGVPLVFLENGEALLGWNDFAILKLRRRRSAAVPRPSFSCHGVLSPSEKAICSSVELSNIDVSLARAYGDTLKGETPDQVPQLLDNQRKWLAGRQRCGANHACLRDLMSERIRKLIDIGKKF